MKTMVLKVILWGREMGRLMWDSDRKTSYFIYNPEVIGGELDMAPLVASVTSPQARMPYFGEEERIYQKLPSFLADSLPDDWGNQLFEFWRTSNKIPTADITPLEKLSFIGSRGMGALEFEPEVELAHGQDKVNLASLYIPEDISSLCCHFQSSWRNSRGIQGLRLCVRRKLFISVTRRRHAHPMSV